MCFGISSSHTILSFISPDFTEGVDCLLKLENPEEQERFINPNAAIAQGIAVDEEIEGLQGLLKAWVMLAPPHDASTLEIIKMVANKLLHCAIMPTSPRGAQVIESLFDSKQPASTPPSSKKPKVDDSLLSAAQAVAANRKTNRTIFQNMPELNNKNEDRKTFVKKVKAIRDYSPAGVEEIDNGKKHVKKAFPNLF